MSFWQQLDKPFFALAPMEAVTDTVFRQVVARAAAPDVWFTEFTNATGWVAAGDPAIGMRLVKEPFEKPVVAQLWGAEPEAMAKLAQYCAQLGFDGLDLNTGCPDSHALKSGGGAALINEPGLTSELIAALKSSGLPVSVKCRLGYSNVTEWENWLGHLLSHKLDALTVHLRTRREMSKVAAHWELMPQIVTFRNQIAPQTLLIGNGDVRDRSHGEQLVRNTGCDGIMIGRGVFTNPFAFEPQPKAHSRDELITLLHYQLDVHDRYCQSHGPRPYDPLKRSFKIYIRDFAGSSDLRSSLMLTRTTNEAREIINAFLSHKQESIMSQASLAGAHCRIKRTDGVRAIVFDSDGTLLDTRQFILEGFMTVLRRHSLAHLASENYIRQRLGKPVPETFAQVLGSEATPNLVKQLAAELNTVQDQLLHCIKPYPHTLAVLRAWREQGIKLCLFTSGDRMMIERNFRAAGLPPAHELFDAIITADDLLPHKPEPDAIQALLKLVGVPANQAIVVGDHPYDIQSGHRAAVHTTIGVLHGLGTAEELTQAGAHHLATSLEDIADLVPQAQV